MNEKPCPRRRGLPVFAAILLVCLAALLACPASAALRHAAYAEDAAEQAASAAEETAETVDDGEDATADATAADGSAELALLAAGTDDEASGTETARDRLDALAAANADTLVEGAVYAIQTAAGGRGVLDVTSGSTSSGANIQLYESNGTEAERFTVQIDEQGYVTFVNVKSGLVLDVKSGNASAGANVQQYKSNGTYAQKWIVVAGSDGTCTIYSALDEGLVLDLAGGSTATKTNVELDAADGTASQSFTFVAAAVDEPSTCEDGLFDEIEWYTLTPACAASCAIDIASGSTSSGANAQSYTANGTFAQLYRFIYCDGYYQIVNVKSGKALGVKNGDVVPGANVAQYTRDADDDAQLWSVTENADGTYTFTNKATALVLDVEDGVSASKTNVDAQTADGGSAQRFTLTALGTYEIEEGVYTIVSALSSSKVLDVKGGYGSDGTNVQLYTSNSTFAQKYYIAPVEGQEGVYTIESLASAKLLTVSSGNNIEQQAASGSSSQWWMPVKTASGITFRSVASPTMAIDVAGAKTANGTNVQLYTVNGTDAQCFSLTATTATVPNGTYWIQLASSYTKVLDVTGGSTSSGTNVQLYTNNGTGAQKWTFTKNSDGSYTIVNAKSGKALDVKSAGTSDGTNVQIYTANSTDAQKWYVEYMPGSGFRIVSALSSSLVLDIAGGATANGTNVQVRTFDGDGSQWFTLRSTTYSESDDYTGAKLAMYKAAQSKSSSSSYLLVVDTSACRVGVFTGSKNNWSLLYYWTCTPGKSSTPTVKGTFTVKNKGYSFGSGYTCYYWTQFYGDYLFHSVLYNQGTFTIQDGRLGQQLSHGCVRLALENAKWIYDYIPKGTTVYIY